MLFTMSLVQIVVVVIVYFFLIISLFHISRIHATFDGNETDRLALLAFKHSILQDPQRALSSWNDSFHFCQWKGVTCDRHHQRVARLDMASRGLAGPLSPYVGNLSFLRVLRIYNNTFRGEIPPQLGHLFRLKTLNLNRNKFVGQVLESIGQLKNLRVLDLGDNKLSGMIPHSFYNLSMLTILSLKLNQFQGTLPPNIGSMLPNLQRLQLHDNKFNGPLPLSLSNCSDLEILELYSNHFNGRLAVDFGGLKKLTKLDIYSNNLGGGKIDEMNFIDSATNCSKLKMLNLGSNKLRGPLPKSVGNLSTQIYFFDLGDNLIYGELPSTIGNLVGITTLSLYGNQFASTIPSSIGNLGKMQRMYLHVNKFSGAIPDSIGNLSLLNELFMSTNKLEGTIPKSLGNCRSLLRLEISQNNLSGSIPIELIGISSLSIALNLSHNHLHGPFPLEIGNLKNLGSLDLSDNSLSGNIPSSLSSCTSLENTFLQGNNLQGPIPSSLSSLKGVVKLDLSRNNLSGQIPRFLEQLAMKYLNLSFNNLEGEVPMSGVFANQSAISIVGNNKLCGGMPELHLHKCYIEESKFWKGKTRVLMIVIFVICTLLCVIIMLCILFCRHKRTSKVRSSRPLLKEPFLKVSYEHLFKATDEFSLENLVGKGCFGSVYKGILDEQVVAVKVLNLQSRGASKSFIIECEALRNVRHRNLVRIITSCSSVDRHGNDFKALLYNFMPNENLEWWLHSSQEALTERGELKRLNFLQRLSISIDVACALDYLHHQCENPIIHCDLKPSNILLDDDMVARVGDFGLAKFRFPELTDTIQSSSFGLKGTIGYAAPEYGLGSEISTKGDVYSFGILLLEMITGKRPTDTMFKEGLTLHNFASMALPENVKDIVDPSILEDYEEATGVWINNSRSPIIEECLVSTIKIGVACSVESPQARMSITNVFHELKQLYFTTLQNGLPIRTLSFKQ